MSRLRNGLFYVGMHTVACVAVVAVYAVVFGRSLKSLLKGQGFDFNRHLADSFGGRKEGPVIYERR